MSSREKKAAVGYTPEMLATVSESILFQVPGEIRNQIYKHIIEPMSTDPDGTRHHISLRDFGLPPIAVSNPIIRAETIKYIVNALSWALVPRPGGQLGIERPLTWPWLEDLDDTCMRDAEIYVFPIPIVVTYPNGVKIQDNLLDTKILARFTFRHRTEARVADGKDARIDVRHVSHHIPDLPVSVWEREVFSPAEIERGLDATVTRVTAMIDDMVQHRGLLGLPIKDVDCIANECRVYMDATGEPPEMPDHSLPWSD